eukprot:TRINITY_DN68975_c0_g1_i1.p2 TRINITY_DN68975_c0_g1~~TRINITY_DN68975_c0_g1_i1.p2  ORF type:complete len:128 (-),score=25.07 TRINITY_DN68975_c0_g1_i1:62-394(-)
MAHSRVLAPLAALFMMAAAASWGLSAFVAPPQQAPQLRGQQAAVAGALGAMLPLAAQAEVVDMDMGSSVNLAGSVEILMIGIVLGTVPTTMLGLFVSAWLQFKKGPTLGL